MAHVLRAWAVNRGENHSVRNLRYGPRTRLVRGVYISQEFSIDHTFWNHIIIILLFKTFYVNFLQVKHAFLCLSSDEA